MNKIESADDRRFPAYLEYQDSGVEWLGEIPAHWEVKRLKAVASVELSNVDKKSVEGQESVRLCNYVNVYYNERITSDLDFMAATATPEQMHRFSLRAGDVLITKDSESWTDIAVAAVVAEDLPGVLCGYHLAHIRPDSDCDGAFLSRAFAAIGPRDQFQIAANGITRFGLGGDAIRTGLFAMPPLAEQRAIAAFLDRETAKIDALIAKKERVIELLREKRAALITRAVTKGLDPNVPLKRSGAEWLGMTSARWEVKKLKFVIHGGLVNGLFKKREDFGSGVRLINVFDIYRDSFLIDENSLERVEANEPEQQAYAVQPGDIFFVRSSLKLEGVAKSACISAISEPTVFECHLVRIRPSIGKIVPRFLILFLNSSLVLQRLVSLANTVTMTTIDQMRLGTIEIAVPPLREQLEIAEYLDRETAEVDALISKIHEGIDCLREYRTALISAAVTGKIDVRNEVATNQAT